MADHILDARNARAACYWNHCNPLVSRSAQEANDVFPIERLQAVTPQPVTRSQYAQRKAGIRHPHSDHACCSPVSTGRTQVSAALSLSLSLSLSLFILQNSDVREMDEKEMIRRLSVSKR